MSDPVRKAIVVGGGIGGLATAAALRQVGIDVVVCERAEDVTHAQRGGGIHIWHNGMRALQALGLADAVERVGARVEQTQFRSWRDAPLVQWEVGPFGRTIGAPTIGVSREDLHPVLLAAQPPGTLRLGSVCTGYSCDATGVTVRFADGGEERGDLLIGADGIHSAVRSQLQGGSPPRHAGYAIWQAVVDFDIAHELVPMGDFHLYWGPGSRFAYYHVGGERLYWFGLVNGRTADADPRPRRAAALDAFAGWPGPIEAMIDATDEAAITRRDIYDRPPNRRWGEGAVTLLGDAAHAMTFNVSQGACQTLEDAVVLMRCLEGGAEIEPALRAYEGLRVRRTAGIQRRAWRIGSVGRWERAAACRVRDAVMGFAFPRFVIKAHERDMVHEL
jgi:2-polyprenyl-6-methoxyphenol hydroxylase-like FAD-dependent oxidoreductase